MNSTYQELIQDICDRLLRHGYPTKERIMQERFSFKPGTTDITLEWKQLYFRGWGQKPEEQKFNELIRLLNALNSFYEGPQLFIIPGINWLVSCSIRPRIRQASGIIVLRVPVSIIHGLHELGHHLFGSRELIACRFSTHLFQDCFPKSFEKLRWSGHILRKPWINTEHKIK